MCARAHYRRKRAATAEREMMQARAEAEAQAQAQIDPEQMACEEGVLCWGHGGF